MLNHCQQLSIPHPDFLDDVEDHPECCCKQKMGLNLQKISQISLTKTLHFMTWCQYVVLVHFKCKSFLKLALCLRLPQHSNVFWKTNWLIVTFQKCVLPKKTLAISEMKFTSHDEDTLPKCLLPRSVRIPIRQLPFITWWEIRSSTHQLQWVSLGWHTALVSSI